MNLAEIVWPVYRLGEKEPLQRDGIVFYYTEYVSSEGINNVTMKIVDDTNIEGDSLGRRRLLLTSSNEKLFPIRTAIYLIADLVKLAKSTTWFIDSSGKVFQYVKNARAKLITKKIKKVLPASGIGCVLELEGIPNRFKALMRPAEHQSYARVLKLGLGFIFYGYCDEIKPDSWRMV